MDSVLIFGRNKRIGAGHNRYNNDEAREFNKLPEDGPLQRRFYREDRNIRSEILHTVYKRAESRTEFLRCIKNMMFDFELEKKKPLNEKKLVYGYDVGVLPGVRSLTSQVGDVIFVGGRTGVGIMMASDDSKRDYLKIFAWIKGQYAGETKMRKDLWNGVQDSITFVEREVGEKIKTRKRWEYDGTRVTFPTQIAWTHEIKVSAISTKSAVALLKNPNPSRFPKKITVFTIVGPREQTTLPLFSQQVAPQVT